MARGVFDGFCQVVALPLTIWHGQCVIDTSRTPIFLRPHNRYISSVMFGRRLAGASPASACASFVWMALSVLVWICDLAIHFTRTMPFPA